MTSLSVSHDEAFQHVQNRRFCVSPNLGFLRQLEAYEPIYRANLSMLQAKAQRQAAGGADENGSGSGSSRRKREDEEDEELEEEERCRNAARLALMKFRDEEARLLREQTQGIQGQQASNGAALGDMYVGHFHRLDKRQRLSLGHYRDTS